MLLKLKKTKINKKPERGNKMSHTSVDSNNNPMQQSNRNVASKIVNSMIVYENGRGQKLECPAGGVRTTGEDIRNEHIGISLNDGAILKDDNGNIICQGTLSEVQARAAQIKAQKQGMDRE